VSDVLPIALPFSKTTPEPVAPPIPTAPFSTVGKTAYPTELLKKRERSGSVFLKTATVSLGSGGPVEEAENQQESYAERFRYHMNLLSGRMLVMLRCDPKS